MADDEKILRIEADVRGGGDQPVTAGGQRSDEADKVIQALDRDRSERTSAERQERDNENYLRNEFSDIISSILKGEDELITPDAGGGGGLPVTPPPGTDVPGGIRQISSDELFGPSEWTPPEANPLADYYYSLLQGRAATAGGQLGAAGGPVNAVGGMGIGGAGGGGGAAGGPPGAAGAGAAGAGAAVTAGGLLSTIGITIGVFTGLTIAVTGLNQIILEVAEGLSNRWKEYSAEMQLADARREYENTMELIRTEGQVSPDYARIQAAQVEVDKEMTQMWAKILQILGPFVEFFGLFTDLILQEFNKLLELVRILTLPIKGIMLLINWALKWINKFTDVEGEDETDEIFQKEILGVLGQFTNMEGMPGPGDKHQYPAPHARTPGIWYR